MLQQGDSPTERGVQYSQLAAIATNRDGQEITRLVNHSKYTSAVSHATPSFVTKLRSPSLTKSNMDLQSRMHANRT